MLRPRINREGIALLARAIVGFVLATIGLSLQAPWQRGGPIDHRGRSFLADLLRVESDGGIVEYPVVDVPASYRVHNWTSPAGQGSCVHASLTMLFNWQGRPDVGEMWRTSYSGGEIPSVLWRKLNDSGVCWAGVTNGDVTFLDWAIRTRRGCAVTVKGGRHMVCLVHLDETRAGILDNNAPGRIVWTSREAFIREWHASQHWAVTPVYVPPPRLPFVAL